MAGDLTRYSHDSLRHVVITATSFALSISTIAVILRLLCRRITKTKWFLDDYLMIGALGFEYGISFAGVVLLYNGLGTHIMLVPADQLIVYMKTLSSGGFLYTACITCVKLSILAFYKRLFPVRPMVLAVNIVGTVIILWCLGVFITSAVVCVPFRKLWEPTIPGTCIDLAKFYYGLQIPNILTDAIILVMPLRVVWNLKMPRAQRVMLTVIFMLGVLTLIFDIIRLIALIELSRSGPDITYNQVNSSVWTCIEPCVGITAACMSNMRPVFNLLPSFNNRKLSFRSSKSDTTEKYAKAPIKNLNSATVVEIELSVASPSVK